MGTAASRQAGRTLANAPKPSTSSTSHAETAIEHKFREDTLRANQSVDYEALENKDENLDSMLNKISGAVKDRHVQIQDIMSQREGTQVAGSSWEGSMPTFAIRELMEENDLAQSRGQTPDLEKYTTRYKIEPEVLQQLLDHACLPHVFKTPTTDGVSAVAEWPQWFKQKSNSS